MKKLFLTSLFATMVAMPAFADNNSYTNNQTYENSCTVDVLFQDSGTAPATAQWSANTYSCAAGEYLPDGDTWTTDNQGCTACPANSYCAGSGNGTFTYSEANDQGITACSSVGNGTYTLSDGSSSSADSCYRNCAAGDVAHLKSGGTVSGRFYSNNTNECVPANDQQCATGYHYVAGTPDLNTLIGTIPADDFIDDPSTMTFSVDFSIKGTITGKARCSSRSATNPWVGTDDEEDEIYVLQSDGTTTTLPNSSGKYCYCMLDGYTPNGGTLQSLSSPWVFHHVDDDADSCADYCASNCMYDLQDKFSHAHLAFRAALFGTISGGLASCQANTITVNWGDGDNNPNNNPTTQCIYDGALTTPATAPTKRGHTFTGWTFSSQQ